MSKRPKPDTQQPPVVQRIRIRYAKRGRLRFTSHRDFARALERAIRRAHIPIGYSSGFSPHPKISYASAAPTGVASEAEYVELGLAEPMPAEDLRAALDAVLPPGLDVLDAVPAGAADFADRVNASRWRVELAGVAPATAAAAVETFLAAAEVPVERMTKSGRRTLDARSPVVLIEVTDGGNSAAGVGNATPAPTDGDPDVRCAILDLVVRHVTPSVRPDDVLAGLQVMAALESPVPPRVTRLAQGSLGAGPLTGRDGILDPLAADRDRAVTGTPST